MIDSSSIFSVVAHVARRLGPLREDVVFLGGAAAALLVTDPIAPKPRPTKDVDVIVEVGSLPEYIELREKLVRLGFSEDMSEGAPRCRWIVDGIKVDVLATDPPMGFPNRWYRQAIAAARPYDLARAGVRTVALRSGGWEAEHLRGAVAIYDNPEDLLRNYQTSPFADQAPST